jgi:hypothetical protein
MHRILSLLIVAAILFAGACKSLVSDVRNVETLDDTRFGELQDECSAIIALGLGPLVRKGALDAEQLAQIADVLDGLGAGVLAPSPSGLLSDVLRREGFTDQEIVGVFVLLQRGLREAGVDLSFATPGPRAAALLHTLADTGRNAAPEPEVESN